MILLLHHLLNDEIYCLISYTINILIEIIYTILAKMYVCVCVSLRISRTWDKVGERG